MLLNSQIQPVAKHSLTLILLQNKDKYCQPYTYSVYGWYFLSEKPADEHPDCFAINLFEPNGTSHFYHLVQYMSGVRAIEWYS